MNPARNASAPGATGAGSHGNGCAAHPTPALATVRELLAARPGDRLAAHLAELVTVLAEYAELQRRRPAA